MQKLSVLIFSRDEVEKTLGLVNDLYDVADDIVLMDSSNKANRNRLHAAKKSQKLGKLQIFYVVSLAPLEALRMYAFKKCRFSWVLLIDTDERLNTALKSKIKSIIGDAKCSAFAIKRYEDVAKGKRTGFYTWQIRLFRKELVEFKGFLHEQATVKGTTEKLDDRYSMDHVAELKTINYGEEYQKMLKLDRLSYGLYNKRVMDYVSKLLMPKSRSVDKTLLGGVINSLMLGYETVIMKKQDEEISNFDYFMYYTLLDLGYALKRQNIKSVMRALQKETVYLKRVNEWRKEPDADEMFEISKIINKTGVVKYLGLDKEATIQKLNRKYGNRKPNGDLLIELIKEEYEKQRKK